MALTIRPAVIAQGAFLTCALAACAHGKPPPIIGVSIQNLHSEFYSALYKSIDSRAKVYGYSPDIQDAGSEAEQQSQVEWFIAHNVDAIVIVPADSKMVGSAVLEANAAEIPVFTTDINSTSIDSNVKAYVASNNLQGGARAALLMCEGVPNHGSVAIIDQPEVSSVHDRVAAFQSAVKHVRQCTKKGVKVVEDVDVGVRHKDAQGATAEIMQAHKGIAGIFFVNDESLLAAFPKLDSRKACIRPILVGYDAIRKIQQEIDRGIVYGDAQQHPDQLGSTTIDEVHDYLSGNRLKNPAVKIAVDTYGPHRCAKGIAPAA